MKPHSTAYPKDSTGISFDPVIHQTNRDGSPRITKSGRYFARGGLAAPRTEARAPRPDTRPEAHAPKPVPHVPPARTSEPTIAPVITSKATAAADAAKTASPASDDEKKNHNRGLLAAIGVGVIGVLLLFTGRSPNLSR